MNKVGLQAVGLSCEKDERLLFSQLNIQMVRGDVLQITGVNGSGKTSLLRILSGLAPATTGEVFWQGQTLRQCRYEYHSQLAYIGHRAALKDHLTVLENLQFACISFPQKNDLHLALKQIGLQGYEDVLASRLSAGQQRRVALTRLLVQDARLWVLDEPLTALDRAGINLVSQLIHDHVSQLGMVVMTSHQLLELSGIIIKKLDLV